MAAPGVDVQFGGHFELFELEIHTGQAFRDVGPVVVTAHEEHGRRIGGWLDPLQAARVDERLEIWASALSPHPTFGHPLPIGWGEGRGEGFVGVKVLRGEEGDFAPGGKTHHADAVGGDAPFGGATAHEAEGALHVGERVVVHGVGGVGLLREAILEHKRRDAAFAEPACDVVTFVVGPEFAMSAARRDDHRTTRGFVRCGQIGREARFVDVGEDAFAALGDADDGVAGLAFRAGCALGPEEDFFLRFGGVRGGEQEQGCEGNREIRERGKA